MKLTFYGATGVVTGSCFLLEAGGKRLLIDCGLFQGSKHLNERNYGPFPFDPHTLDAVLLTHAHIDHSGLLPKLIRQGYAGPIYATDPTKDLLHIMLADSAFIQESEVARKNRRRQRQGLPPLTPIYTGSDAEKTHAAVVTKPFRTSFPLSDGLTASFWPAGHMLGAASIVVTYHPDGEKPVSVAFSGDIGVANQPLIVDAAPLPPVDVVVMESTYGDRLRLHGDDRYERLSHIVRQTFSRGGNVIIPAFAVGRVQDLLYGLHRMIHSGELDPANVFVDSPLAARATDIFCDHVESFDEEAQRFAHVVGDCPLYLRDLRLTRTQEESMAINRIRSGAIVISSSGMCEAGRIKHHLRHNLWRKESSIVFVSYQGAGTLGRHIVDGRPTVRIHGESINVRAEIHNLEGFSAHADQKELIQWAKNFHPAPKRIYLVHGEPQAQQTLQQKLIDETGIDVHIPTFGETVRITSTVAETVAAGSAITAQQQYDELWQVLAALRSNIDRLERHGASAPAVTTIVQKIADTNDFVEKQLKGMSR